MKMKKLILIRHANANDKSIAQQDDVRNLSALGKFQAQNVATHLKNKNCLPDYLLCSPSNRTIQTATLLCNILQFDPNVIKESDILYSGDTEDILNALLRVPTTQHLWVVGHNPCLTSLAHRLCADTKTIVLPPAGTIGLEFEIENWSELSKTQGRLLFFIEPQHACS